MLVKTEPSGYETQHEFRQKKIQTQHEFIQKKIQTQHEFRQKKIQTNYLVKVKIQVVYYTCGAAETLGVSGWWDPQNQTIPIEHPGLGQPNLFKSDDIYYL